MRHRSIAMLAIAALILTACGGSRPFTRATVPPLDSAVTAPCLAPEALLGSGDWLIVAGALGTALIECDASRAAAVAAYEGVANVIRP